MFGSLFKSPLDNFIESFVDNVIRDKVSPCIGSLVYCDLVMGRAEHSGIYIGKDKIVHLNGDGIIEVVYPDEFLNRLDGWNTAISIYVSCHDGDAVGSANVAERAERMVGRKRDYNLLLDNCHQFSFGCLSGNFENSCNSFRQLKQESNRHIGADEWRVWDL